MTAFLHDPLHVDPHGMWGLLCHQGNYYQVRAHGMWCLLCHQGNHHQIRAQIHYFGNLNSLLFEFLLSLHSPVDTLPIALILFSRHHNNLQELCHVIKLSLTFLNVDVSPIHMPLCGVNKKCIFFFKK